MGEIDDPHAAASSCDRRQAQRPERAVDVEHPADHRFDAVAPGAFGGRPRQASARSGSSSRSGSPRRRPGVASRGEQRRAVPEFPEGGNIRQHQGAARLGGFQHRQAEGLVERRRGEDPRWAKVRRTAWADIDPAASACSSRRCSPIGPRNGPAASSGASRAPRRRRARRCSCRRPTADRPCRPPAALASEPGRAAATVVDDERAGEFRRVRAVSSREGRAGGDGRRRPAALPVRAGCASGSPRAFPTGFTPPHQVARQEWPR
jgi:hypothetical protein